MEFKSKTLGNSVYIEGVGVHTGEICKLIIHPAEGGGIRFYKKGRYLPAHHRYVINTVGGTDLGNALFEIKTVEHLMAALYLLGISDAVIEVIEGYEVPILDGGAKVFVDLFREVGTVELEGFQKVFVITQRGRIQPNGNFVEMEPFNGTILVYEGIFPYIGRKKVSYSGEIKEALIGARTYCDAKDVPLLWLNNLGKGGYIVNTLPLTEDLRFLVYSEEPAYHKLLDLIGDLALLGGRVIGKVYSFKGNHTLNHSLRDWILKTAKVVERKEEPYLSVI